jgi:heterotetrameric sarcosine oxidase gamma subunit
MSARHRPLEVTVERLPPAPTREFVSFAATTSGDAWSDGCATPGQVEWLSVGTACRLYFAPRRWLVVGDCAELRARLAAACDAGVGTSVDVEGKWAALRLDGPDARLALASTVDIDAVLLQRDCAALTLFDCPAVVMREGAAYRMWVAASCAAAFEAAINALSGRES